VIFETRAKPRWPRSRPPDFFCPQTALSSQSRTVRNNPMPAVGSKTRSATNSQHIEPVEIGHTVSSGSFG